MTATTYNVGCPSCGGTLPYAEGLRLLACDYCGSKACVVVPGALRRSFVEPLLDREQLDRVLTRTLSTPAFAPGLAGGAREADARLLFLPFYEVSALRSVRNEARITKLGEPQTDTRMLLTGVRLFTPAIRDERFGLAAVEAPGLRGAESTATIRAFDVARLQRFGCAIDPDIPLGPLLGQLRTGGDEGRADTLEETAQLLWYPVWQVLLTSAGNGYRLVVDAVEGRVLAGRAPGNNHLRSLLPVVSLAIVCWLLGRLLRLTVLGAGVPGDSADYSLTPFMVIALLAAGVAAWVTAREAWNSFRYDYEVEWVGGLARPVRLGAPAGSWAEPLSERVMGWLEGFLDGRR
jgi:hypothetical protein